MRLSKLLAGVALAAVTLAAGSAGAATVDFNSYSGTNCVTTPISEGGLTFATQGFFNCQMGAGTQEAGKADNGTGFLINGYSDSLVTGPASFVLNSLDIGQSYYSGASDLITITRYLVGGGTLSTVVNSTNSFQTVAFSNDAITSFRVSQNSGYFALDNVTYDVAAVPEPATWALMIGGFGLAGAGLRRRKAAFA